jgi:ADP-ribose pyrophosphatase YjhB (NUDIX family)
LHVAAPDHDFSGPVAGVVVRRDGELLLICDEEAPDAWTVPGGNLRSNETFEAAARRELREETGLDCDLTGIHSALRGTAVADDGGESLTAIAVFFEGEADTIDLSVDSDEIVAARWWADPPNDLVAGMRERIFRKVAPPDE